MPTLLALALTLAQANTAAITDPCTALLKEATLESGSPRAVITRDLATLTDIGRADSSPSPTPFGVSPDRRSIAFFERQANPETNSYCQRLMVMAVDGSGLPRELARGGDHIRTTFDLRGVANYPAGFEAVVAPKWSPDGKTIAYLRKDGGPTQIWLVGTDGETAHPVTSSPDEIEDFVWARDGRGFIVATRPGLRQAEQRYAEEAKTGYLYDQRFDPMWGNEPLVLGPIPTVHSYIEIATGAVRDASPEEAALLEPSLGRGWQKGWRQSAMSSTGNHAVVTARTPGALLSLSSLSITWSDGRTSECRSSVCDKIANLWWSPDGTRLTFKARVGWGHSEAGFFTWRAGEDHPIPILVTPDAVIGCTQIDDRAICAREGSLMPRRIVAIDLADGRQTKLLDPNPRFGHLRLGAARRFIFKNAFGIECYADFVLPPDHKPGQKHPMVVVQYTTDGFLRGSTGDEEPIQALAARGFAVLSFNHPAILPAQQRATTEVELDRAGTAGFAQRRSTQSALDIAVDKALATGTVDASRIGISGMSEGTSTTQWALTHSARYKAVALGVCCEEQTSTALNGGQTYETYLLAIGYPPFDKYEHKFWPQLSLARNVDRIDAPILVQSGGNEYQVGLYTAQAFRNRGKAFDFYVMPGEPHIKWQPSHRLAMYNRNLDWFSFWLLHQRDCSAAKDGQFTRWLAMPGAPATKDVVCWRGSVAEP